MKKINSFLLIFTFLSSIFATNLHSMKRSADDARTSEISEETRYSKQPRRFLHGLRTFLQKQNSDQTNHFDELPNELLVKIFADSNPTKDELIKLSKVSKKFHNIALDKVFINPEIHEYETILNSVINFDTSTNTLNLNHLNSSDRVKALLGFKFLIQVRDKSLFFKASGIDSQLFCVAQYNALLRFLETLNNDLNKLRIDAELEISVLEKSVLGIDAPYTINLANIYPGLTINLKQKNNILININNLAYGETPLMIASKLYLININLININLIKALLILGADVNTKSIWQNTLLHFALKNNLPEIAILLLENNANFRIKNNIGETALELAARLNNSEINKVLIPKLTWYERQSFNFARFFKARVG